MYYEKFKVLIDSLKKNFGLEDAFNDYIDIGETSGADILTGFIVVMEKLLDMED